MNKLKQSLCILAVRIHRRNELVRTLTPMNSDHNQSPDLHDTRAGRRNDEDDT